MFIPAPTDAKRSSAPVPTERLPSQEMVMGITGEGAGSGPNSL
jgi:hypothetical protein